jgi:hypothetical protein
VSTLTAEGVETAMQQMYGSVEVDAKLVEGGDGVAAGSLLVTVTTPEGCHIQAHEPGDPFLIPLVVEFDEGSPVGPFVYPEPEEVTLSWSPKVLRVHHGVVRIEVPLTHKVGTARGRVSYQACTETMCLWPAEQRFEVPLG